MHRAVRALAPFSLIVHVLFCPSATAENTIFCKQHESKAVVTQDDGAVTKIHRSVWMIVRPNHYRYLFNYRGVLNAATGQLTSEDPAIWSTLNVGWPDNGGFVTLEYRKDGQWCDYFKKREGHFTVLGEDGPASEVRMDYTGRDLNCALLYAYGVKDRKLRLDILLDPNSAIDAYRLTFRCKVVGGEKPIVRTPCRTIGPRKDIHAKVCADLDPVQEYRFIYTAEDAAGNRPFALVAMPGQASRAQLTVSWMVHTTFEYGGEACRLTFLIYDPWDDHSAGMSFLTRVEVEPVSRP